MATTPLEGVTVTAFRWENDTSTYTNQGSDTTDALGEYEISGLWQGRSYKVKFEKNGYLAIYYADTGFKADLETGGPIYMTTDLEVDATLSQGGTISGTVEGEIP